MRCALVPCAARVQARELIELKKQQLAEAKLWRKQQEEYEVRGAAADSCWRDLRVMWQQRQ